MLFDPWSLWSGYTFAGLSTTLMFVRPSLYGVYTGFYSILLPPAPYDGVRMKQPFFLIPLQSGDGIATPSVLGIKGLLGI